MKKRGRRGRPGGRRSTRGGRFRLIQRAALSRELCPLRAQRGGGGADDRGGGGGGRGRGGLGEGEDGVEEEDEM